MILFFLICSKKEDISLKCSGTTYQNKPKVEKQQQQKTNQETLPMKSVTSPEKYKGNETKQN